MNILVLSDNKEVLERAKPIFLKRSDCKWIFTNSDDINPKLDYNHIIKTYNLVFSLHCKKIFPKELVEGVRCINIHPGFNPWNRGMFPHVFSMINGMSVGFTIHEMTGIIDGGPCFIQEEIEPMIHETSLEFYHRIITHELDALDCCLDSIINDTIKAFEYIHRGNYNSFEDFKELCEIDLSQSGTFREFYNLLRALSHPPYWNAHIAGTDIYLRLCIQQKQPQTQLEKKL